MGEISDVVGGGTPKTNDPANFEGGDVPWITPADLSGYTAKYISRGNRFITRKGLASSAARLLPAGTVLFTSRAPVGYVAIAGSPIATNQGFKSFVLKDCVLPDYVYWWLRGSKHRAEKLASGTTFLELSGASAKKIPIPVVPLERQRAVVAEIEKQFSRLDEAVAGLKRVKANLKRYKAAILKAAVEGRLVETEADLARREGRSYETGAQLLQRILEARRSQWQGKGKYKEPTAPDTTDLPELPEAWAWATAEQVCDFITKGTTPSADKLADGSGEIQFLKVYNLTFDGVLNYRYKPAFVSRETHDNDLARSKVVAGDVLINIVGPPLGQVSVVPDSIGEANINQAIARFRPVAPLDSAFLTLLLRCEDVMRWVISRAKTTSGQSNLTLELCRLLPMPLPPLGEQHRIVCEVDRLLSIAREVEAEVETNLKRAKRLRQAVLTASFQVSAKFVG